MQARAKKFLRQVNPKNTKKKKNATRDESNELYDPQNFMQTIRVGHPHDSSMHAQHPRYTARTVHSTRIDRQDAVTVTQPSLLQSLLHSRPAHALRTAMQPTRALQPLGAAR